MPLATSGLTVGWLQTGPRGQTVSLALRGTCGAESSLISCRKPGGSEWR